MSYTTTSPKIQSKTLTATYHAQITPLSLFFLMSNYLAITTNPTTYPKNISMGYPPFFIPALSIPKILGVTALAIPNFKPLKEWAFVGFTFDVIFVFISTVSIASYADCTKEVIVLIVIPFISFVFQKRTA